MNKLLLGIRKSSPVEQISGTSWWEIQCQYLLLKAGPLVGQGECAIRQPVAGVQSCGVLWISCPESPTLARGPQMWLKMSFKNIPFQTTVQRIHQMCCLVGTGHCSPKGSLPRPAMLLCDDPSCHRKEVPHVQLSGPGNSAGAAVIKCQCDSDESVMCCASALYIQPVCCIMSSDLCPWLFWHLHLWAQKCKVTLLPPLATVLAARRG